MEQRRRQETVQIKATLKTTAGALTDADTHTIHIEDPFEQVVVNGVAMTKTATGTYKYYYTSASTVRLGTYKAEATLTKDDIATRPVCWFEIVDEIA
jgi:type 1 fimbria pilin